MRKNLRMRLFSVLTTLCMLLALLPTTVFAAGSDWSTDDSAKTVSIYTATGLREWADSVRANNNKYDGYTISIENDIDLGGTPWSSIMSLGGTVTIDGNNHTISNMSISEDHTDNGGNTYLGFIGNINYNTNLTVKNITFENAHVQDTKGDAESSWCGVVVGHGPMDGVKPGQAVCLFENVNIVNSVVTGGHNNGGIMGYSCSTEGSAGIVFDNCSVTNTFVGGYNSTSGILFGMGIADVTVRNCKADGVILYTDGLNFDCSQSWDEQLWLGNVYPVEIYDVSRYGSNGTATYEGTNTIDDNTYVVYPVIYHYADGDVQEYVQVNTTLTGTWYSDEECTTPVTQITADLTNNDMYPYGTQATANTQGYATQQAGVANPLTHGAIALYSTANMPDKASYPGLDKQVQTGVDGDGQPVWGDADTAAAGDKVDFKLTSNVPDDLLNYIEADPANPPEVVENSIATLSEDGRGSYALTIHDQMDDELVLDKNNIQVKIGDTVLSADDNEYTVSYDITHSDDESICDFEITIDLVALYEAGTITDADIESATKIVVTYSATLSESAVAGTYENTAWASYPEGETEKDTVTVKTYAIELFKYDQGTQAGLAGAQFELYGANAYTQQDDGTWTKTEGAEALKDGIVSGTNGYVTIGGLDVGTYYLVETAAPNGYICSDTPLEIVIPDDADTDNVAHVQFANSPIPHTGGTGTMMYTVGGAALLVLAGALLVVNRISRKKQEY